MTGNESKASTKDNPLVRALARWEWEGGSSIEPDWEKRAALVQEEEHILHCLGAAVIMHEPCEEKSNKLITIHNDEQDKIEARLAKIVPEDLWVAYDLIAFMAMQAIGK